MPKFFVPNKLTKKEKIQYLWGEFLCHMGKTLCKKGAAHLFASTWTSHHAPEWFDHRLTMYDNERF